MSRILAGHTLRCVFSFVDLYRRNRNSLRGVTDGETPEEYLCHMETLHELMAVLDTCTEAQRRRFLLYALEGLSLAEIGVLCGCSKVAVYQSVEAVRKKFINFFE
ncbi:MAG: sigma-70 family RNA polymerase sigma factor, partial [Desulfovibrionaceae bacterium]|nr:sigma-70 family RNA polymerase sigma factor [Desulfovibrionaceae bacterium]